MNYISLLLELFKLLEAFENQPSPTPPPAAAVDFKAEVAKAAVLAGFNGSRLQNLLNFVEQNLPSIITIIQGFVTKPAA